MRAPPQPPNRPTTAPTSGRSWSGFTRGHAARGAGTGAAATVVDLSLILPVHSKQVAVSEVGGCPGRSPFLPIHRTPPRPYWLLQRTDTRLPATSWGGYSEPHRPRPVEVAPSPEEPAAIYSEGTCRGNGTPPARWASGVCASLPSDARTTGAGSVAAAGMDPHAFSVKKSEVLCM